MTITDPNLATLIARLTPEERGLVEKHMRGKETEESWEIMRRIRASLKRKARSKLPRKLVWLG
jgi:hypothetical protein